MTGLIQKKSVKKKQHNPQIPVQNAPQMMGRMQPGQMPPIEDSEDAKREKLAGEIREIEKKLLDIATEEYMAEEQIRQEEPKLADLSAKLREAKEKAAQNPQSEDLQKNLADLNQTYQNQKESARKLISRLFEAKNKKYAQQKNHGLKILMAQGKEITAELEDQITAERLEIKSQELAQYNREPWISYISYIPGSIEKINKRRDDYLERVEMTRTAKYLERETTGYNHQEQINKWRNTKSSQDDVISDYLGKVDRLWENEEKRKEFLSPEHIIQSIKDSFYLIDYYLFAKIWRKEHPVSLAQKAAVERADRIMEYYQKHVNTILNDYGMDINNRHYDKKKIEALAEGKKMPAQSSRWSSDWHDYQALTENKQDQWEILENPYVVDASLRQLERRVGLGRDQVQAKDQAQDQDQAQAKDQAQAQDQVQAQAKLQGEDEGAYLERSEGYYRYRTNILESMEDYKNIANKKRRILQVAKAMVANLQRDHVWKENSAFNGILACLDRDIQNHQAMNVQTLEAYEKKESEIRTDLEKELHRAIKTASSSQEKQYAAELYNWMRMEEQGNLIKPENPKKEIYRSDSNLDIDEEEKEIEKKKCHHFHFVSVKDKPLFPHDPTLKDFGQGKLGDCFFIAAVSSLVARSPGKIKEMMRDNMDGTVTVRFYDKKGKKYLYVKVDKTIGEMKNAKGKNIERASRGAIWIKLLEKAYASIRDYGSMNLNNKSGKWNYVGAVSGEAYRTITDLTGVKARTSKIVTNDFSMFRGRMDEGKINTWGKYKMETPALIYYEAMHKNDRSAFDYLAGRSVSWRKKGELKKELNRNKKVEDFLKKQMLLDNHELEIDVMDQKAFVETLKKSYQKLEGYIGAAKRAGREGHTLYYEENLLGKEVPREMRKLLSECWNLCGKQGSELKKVALGLVESYEKKVKTEGRDMDIYTDSEKAFYQQIKTVLDQKKDIELESKIYKVKEEQRAIKGTEGESYLNGIFSQHAYTLLNTETHQVGNKTKIFLRLRNPHGLNIPLYQIGEDNRLKRVGFVPGTKNEKAYAYSTNGVFLMELRDAKNFFKKMHYSE